MRSRKCQTGLQHFQWTGFWGREARAGQTQPQTCRHRTTQPATVVPTVVRRTVYVQYTPHPASAQRNYNVTTTLDCQSYRKCSACSCTVVFLAAPSSRGKTFALAQLEGQLCWCEWLSSVRWADRSNDTHLVQCSCSVHWWGSINGDTSLHGGGGKGFPRTPFLSVFIFCTLFFIIII